MPPGLRVRVVYHPLVCDGRTIPAFPTSVGKDLVDGERGGGVRRASLMGREEAEWDVPPRLLSSTVYNKWEGHHILVVLNCDEIDTILCFQRVSLELDWHQSGCSGSHCCQVDVKQDGVLSWGGDDVTMGCHAAWPDHVCRVPGTPWCWSLPDWSHTTQQPRLKQALLIKAAFSILFK